MSFSGLVHDLRTSVRGLSRRPFYPMVAVIILTLGLSAAVAVFTYINGFYQPFPGVDADRLVRVFGVEDENANQDISYLDFLDYAAAGGAFAGIAAAQPFYAASVRLESMTEVAWLEAVSGSYFSVLDVEMSVGRALSVDDDRPGSDPAAVISHAWWLRSFNGDSAVIGSTIYLNFRPFTVVGVAAPEFLGTASSFRPDVWIPFAPFKDRYTRWAAFSEDRDVPLVRVYGRLRDGVREGAALVALQALAAGLDEAYPSQTGPRSLRLGPATWIDPRARHAEQATVRLMIVGAGVLLLLVCANVANLLLSVAVGRQREISMRAALGASPGRLLRQVLIENVLLAGLAGGVALALAGPVSARLGSYFARPSVWGANVAREAAVDLRVVAFALAIAVVTGLVAGLLPAIRASRRDLVDTLKIDATLPIGGPSRIWGLRLPGVHDILVAAQVALAVLLLVVAGLVLRTLGTVGDVDPGFSFDRLVVTHISTSSTTLEIDERDRFFREVAARVGEEPWARAATVADYPLLSPHMSAELRLDGQSDPVTLIYSKVIPGFFEALGIEVVQGRSFVAGDTAGAPDVAVVNEKLANRYFAGEASVGRRLWWPARDGADRAFEIVGVVRDTKTQDFLGETEPTAYFSYPQHAYPTGSALLVATTGHPGAAVPYLHRWLRDFEPHLAIVNVVTYNDVVRGFLYTHRMNAEMFSGLAFLGLALAAVGIFSVMSLAVSRRTREIGIRMSIGAQRSDIGRLMVGRALVPVALGLGVGLTASLALTELVRTLLYGVEPVDPLTLAAGTGVLIAAALSAAYIPARRAATVDPMTAVRHE
ncbi:MAG: ABC transporter permease [Gemmatimonadota bacterium]|nr:MAG: ABC transporter permease [Gemmatimonadota bacterium]